jgi:hypothetical protein
VFVSNVKLVFSKRIQSVERLILLPWILYFHKKYTVFNLDISVANITYEFKTRIALIKGVWSELR